MLNKLSKLSGSLRCVFTTLMVSSVFFHGCVEKEKAVEKGARAVPVITGEVSTRRVEYTLNQVGSMESSQDVTLRSEIDGRIIAILFSEGKAVNKGQVLLRLDSAKIQAEIRNLDARIDQLEIRSANRERTLERNRSLVEQNLVSRQWFDDLQTEIEEIAKEIIQGRASLAFQKERLSDTVIRAPFDGVAGVRDISTGDYLKQGDPVVTVVDLDPLEISFQVAERFKPNLVPDQEVVLTLAPYPGRRFKGVIFFISPRVETDTRTFQVKARVDNSHGLLSPGMFAKVQVITEVHESAVIVPWNCVIQTESETYIYILEEDVARKAPVRLGKITGEWAEILSPDLASGTRVIIEGKFAVRDGTKVVVQQTPESRGTGAVTGG